METPRGTVLLLGTRKGLWVGRSDEGRTAWSWEGPHHEMQEVHAVAALPGGRVLAAGASSWLGPQVWRSDDLLTTPGGGASWEGTPEGALRFGPDDGASVEAVWALEPGSPADAPGTVWAGSQPAALWRSEDSGETFALVRGLWDHEHRPHWQPGFGGQAFHTVLPHPTDPARLLAALSSGGLYGTEDGGTTWEPRNQGIKVEFLPEGKQYPAWGQCVHKVDRHPDAPELLLLQNHGGVFRSEDEGRSWVPADAGLPATFGFPVVAHPHQPGTFFVFPVEAGERRWPPGARAAVWRTRDAGRTWEECADGLPERFFVGVVRDAMAADDHAVTGLYVGGRNGGVWGSTDDGASWRTLVTDLPDVLCVRAYAVPG